jgi:hypothetical protein
MGCYIRRKYVACGDHMEFLEFYLRDKNTVYRILMEKLSERLSTESEGECTVTGLILRR